MDKFLGRVNEPRLNHKEIEKSEQTNSGKEIECVIKNFSAKKSPNTDSFTGEFFQIFKQQSFSNSSKKIKEEGRLSNVWCCYSVSKSCLTVCDPMDCRMPGFPVHRQLPELAQTHMSIEPVMSSNHLILSCPPSPPPSLSISDKIYQIKVVTNNKTVHKENVTI